MKRLDELFEVTEELEAKEERHLEEIVRLKAELHKELAAHVEAVEILSSPVPSDSPAFGTPYGFGSDQLGGIQQAHEDEIDQLRDSHNEEAHALHAEVEAQHVQVL